MTKDDMLREWKAQNKGRPASEKFRGLVEEARSNVNGLPDPSAIMRTKLREVLTIKNQFEELARFRSAPPQVEEYAAQALALTERHLACLCPSITAIGAQAKKEEAEQRKRAKVERGLDVANMKRSKKRAFALA